MKKNKILAVFLGISILFPTIPKWGMDVHAEEDLFLHYTFDNVNGTTVPNAAEQGHEGTFPAARVYPAELLEVERYFQMGMLWGI